MAKFYKAFGSKKRCIKTRFFWGIEVRSRDADSFLGNVFKDGTQPMGLRFCMNSAAMEFVPKVDLIKRGYGAYVTQFNKQKL